MATARPLLAPTVECHGPFATHNMPCSVHQDEHAVLNCNTGVFRPSWKAQASGYMLVKVPRWLRWLLRNYEA